MAETGGGKKTTYAWIFADPKGTMIDCYTSTLDSQTVCGLWEVSALAAYHDQELADATKRINAIVDGVEKSNKDRTRKLSYIEFENRLMMVWAQYGAVGPDDDFPTIKKALKLREP